MHAKKLFANAVFGWRFDLHLAQFAYAEHGYAWVGTRRISIGAAGFRSRISVSFLNSLNMAPSSKVVTDTSRMQLMRRHLQKLMAQIAGGAGGKW